MTGKAGTGKITFPRETRKSFQEKKVVAVLLHTGVAAEIL
jgi:hypothetical protein